MHEAETLCTKIGILVNGKFQCMGSPDFLKKKYGDGYRITLKIKGAQNAEYVDKHIAENLQVASNIVKYDGRQVIYSIKYKDFSFY